MRTCPPAVIITCYWSDRKRRGVEERSRDLAGWRLLVLSWTDDSLIFSYTGGGQSRCSSGGGRVLGFSLRVSDHLFCVPSSPSKAGGSSRRPPLIDSEPWRAKLSGHLRTPGSWRYFCRWVGLAKELWSYADDREQRRTPQTLLMWECRLTSCVMFAVFRGNLCARGCSVETFEAH